MRPSRFLVAIASVAGLAAPAGAAAAPTASIDVKLPDSGRFGNKFDFPVPPIPTVPGSPNASVLDFSTTLGATNRVKEKRRTVTHHLITAPKTCPAGGWPFRGEFTFVDGSSAAAETTVKCRGASR